MAKPLLTFETLAPDAPTIEIDGTEYELAMPEDYGLREEAEHARLLRQAAKILEEIEAIESDDLAQPMVDKLEALLGGFIAVILKAPEDVRARLRFRQKLAIAQAFTRAVSGRAATTPSPAPTRRRSTSGSSRRASPRRTARATGSASRSASSRLS